MYYWIWDFKNGRPVRKSKGKAIVSQLGEEESVPLQISRPIGAKNAEITSPLHPEVKMCAPISQSKSGCRSSLKPLNTCTPFPKSSGLIYITHIRKINVA